MKAWWNEFTPMLAVEWEIYKAHFKSTVQISRWMLTLLEFCALMFALFVLQRLGII